jgi:GH25 family lysozyme M1 (1,4-beta-N-acetylmuramidase)
VTSGKVQIQTGRTLVPHLPLHGYLLQEIAFLTNFQFSHRNTISNMKFLTAAVVIAFGLVIGHPTSDIEARVPGVPGCDVSAGQGDVDWAAAKADGCQFCYIKVSLHV